LLVLNPAWKLAYTEKKWEEEAHDASVEQLYDVVRLLSP
jgi:hypothetical protein